MEKVERATMTLRRSSTAAPIGGSPGFTAATMRTKQCERIRAIRKALADAGFVSLTEQATALGLPRSTTWALLEGLKVITRALGFRLRSSPAY